MTRTFGAVILALLVACAPASAGDIVRSTHKVSVEGECGLVGDGTLTVTFKKL
jgi:hypothetical protein